MDDLKTVLFENAVFLGVDGENDVIWKRWRHHNNTIGLQTTEPWVAKMFQVASLFFIYQEDSRIL